jgi:uncharacterized membrane protein
MPSSKNRVTAIDALRGLIMVIMALDHVRDFIHRDAMLFAPNDLTRTTPVLFFTRWITHFCAPVFVFTAGMGAFFWWRHGRTRSQLSRFLVTRGLWLIALEVTVIQFGYYFNLPGRFPVLLLVLWVIGLSMIGLAGLVWLPARLLAVLSVATILLHNTLDGVKPSPLWAVLHSRGAIQLGGLTFVVGYPLIPWIAVMAAGFCFGRVFEMEPAARRRVLLRLGSGATAAFLALRAVNIYGDPVRWSAQKSAVFTALSFLNCTKYPPSLDFLLMTLGPALLVLLWLDRLDLAPGHPLVIYGRVPLFYFVLHFLLAHAAGVGLALLRYGSRMAPLMTQPFPSETGPNRAFPPGFGWPLWVTYLVWIAIVLLMYPLCRWFARVKATRRNWWLSYL